MLCNLIDAAKEATENLVIDGCPVDCGKHVMDRVGVCNYRHLRVTDLGIEKVKGAWANEQQVQLTVDAARADSACEHS